MLFITNHLSLLTNQPENIEFELLGSWANSICGQI